MKQKRSLFLLTFCVVVLALTACSGSGPVKQDSPSPAVEVTAITNPASQTVTEQVMNGQQLVETRCTVCHSLDRVKSAKKSGADWGSTVKRMVGKGAQLTDAEQTAVIQYLSETYK
jgi:cytochrome c5